MRSGMVGLKQGLVLLFQSLACARRNVAASAAERVPAQHVKMRMIRKPAASSIGAG
jgi:hypothetical protein